jgi:hypothetical protein
LTGASIVPTFVSLPVGATKIARSSLITHALSAGVLAGSQGGFVSIGASTPASSPVSASVVASPSLGASDTL